MKFVLGVYSQLPYGSEDEIMEAVISKTLKPLLTDLYSEPSRKMVLNFSVAEFEYLESKHPELNMLIYDLCKKNQLEILSNSYYDVMLPLIPSHERSIQVEKTTTYIRKRFGKRPKGLWCLQQYFSPYLIPVLSMSSLDYIIISSYSQTQNCVLANKPFYMEESGKSGVIFPADDRFSKELWDFSQNKTNEEKLTAAFEKYITSCKETLNTVMLNIDQMVALENSTKLMETIFREVKEDCVLPSQWLLDNPVTKLGYFPWGIYGRDIDIGKTTSINQQIIENNLKNRYFRILNSFKEQTKELKKNSDLRIKLENAILKANSSSIFINGYYKNPVARIIAGKNLCELENLVASQQAMPSVLDINGNRIETIVACSKNNVAYLNPKGAQINRLSITSCLWDLVNHNSDGLFCDTFVNTITGKKVNLSSRKFEFSTIDKKRLDFLAILSSVDLGQTQINLIKRFKFRQNAIVVEIEIENTGSNSLENYLYECSMNLFLSETCELSATDSEGIQNFCLEDRSIPFTINFGFSDKVGVESKHFFMNEEDWLGNRQFYQYTQINIIKKLSLKPIQEDHLSLAMRIEKRKEKR